MANARRVTARLLHWRSQGGATWVAHRKWRAAGLLIFPAKWPVYPDLLEAAGYAVGFTGKGWGPGDWQAGGFRRNPAGRAFQQFRAPPPYRGIANTDYARNLAAFLAARKPGQPFCFWLGGQEP